MSNDWSTATLGELSKMRYGKLVAKSSLQKTGYPVWSGYSIVGYHDTFMIEEPEVSITCRGVGGTGDIHMTPARGWVTNLAIVITPLPDAKLNKKFLYWAMKATDRSSLITGSAQSQITIEHLRYHTVSFPSFEEQQKIVAVLDSLDDKIEQNRRTSRKLKGLARAVFKAWFVDFEPIKAKAAGANAFPGMPPETFANLANTFQMSSLGPVPQGWKVRRLQEVLTLNYGRALTKAKRQPGQVPVYGSGSVNGTHNQALVAGPGIIVGRKGSVGTLYWEAHGFFPIDTTFYVESAADIGLHYLFELLQTLGLETMNTDAAVAGLNRDNAYRLEVVVPSTNVSGYFNHYAKSLRELISHATAESARLASPVDTGENCERCGSTRVIDTPIHRGQSARRDCAACGRTRGFPVWTPEAQRA